MLRMSPGEEALLWTELECARDPVAVLAATFALEMGCRRSEQYRLEWKDYDRALGTIWLADAKNGRGRYILLTLVAQTVLDQLPGRAEGGKIFKITGDQLKQAFENARERAARHALVTGCPDLASVRTLRWHDLRHEAISRCFDAGWTSEQVMDFSGHFLNRGTTGEVMLKDLARIFAMTLASPARPVF